MHFGDGNNLFPIYFFSLVTWTLEAAVQIIVFRLDFEAQYLFDFCSLFVAQRLPIAVDAVLILLASTL